MKPAQIVREVSVVDENCFAPFQMYHTVDLSAQLRLLHVVHFEIFPRSGRIKNAGNPSSYLLLLSHKISLYLEHFRIGL